MPMRSGWSDSRSLKQNEMTKPHLPHPRCRFDGYATRIDACAQDQQSAEAARPPFHSCFTLTLRLLRHGSASSFNSSLCLKRHVELIPSVFVHNRGMDWSIEIATSLFKTMFF